MNLHARTQKLNELRDLLAVIERGLRDVTLSTSLTSVRRMKARGLELQEEIRRLERFNR